VNFTPFAAHQSTTGRHSVSSSVLSSIATIS